MAPQPPAGPQPMTVTTTPLPALTEYTAADGSARTTPFDGVLIVVENDGVGVVSFFQSPEDAMTLANHIATAAGKATRYNVGDDGKLPALAERLKRLAGK